MDTDNPFAKYKAPNSDNPFSKYMGPAPVTPPPAAQQPKSWFERTKEALTPNADTLKNLGVGAVKGLSDVAYGAEQLAGKAGSSLGIPGSEALENRAKKQLASNITEFAPTVAASPVASRVGEFIGGAAPFAGPVAGGVTGGALRRAGAAAATGAGIGAIAEPNTPVSGAIKGAAFGAAGSGLTSAAGKVANAITDNIPETVTSKLSKKWNIPTTLAEATTGAPSRTDIMLERAPGFLGSKGFRAEQQEAARNAAKDFLGNYIADPANPTQEGNRAFVSNLYGNVKNLVAQVPPAKQTITPSETQKAANDLLGQFSNIFKQFQDTSLEKKITDIAAGSSGPISFDDAWQLRQGLGEMIGQAKRQELSGGINKTASSKIKQLFGAVSKDMDNWAGSIGQPQIAGQFRAANDAYKTFVVKQDILQRAYDKVIKEVGDKTYFSPQKFATEIGRQVGKNKYTQTFTGPEITEMTGLANILQTVKRAGQYMENPPTANRWGPAALGLGMEGTAYQVAGMTRALKTAGVAAMLTGATRILTTTAIGKRLAMAASRYNPNGRAMSRLVTELYRLIHTAAAVGGEQATAPMQQGGEIPGVVQPGAGDNTLTPMQTGEYVIPVDAIIAAGREMQPGLDDQAAHALGKQWLDHETERLKQLAGNPVPPNNAGPGRAEGGVIGNPLSMNQFTMVGQANKPGADYDMKGYQEKYGVPVVRTPGQHYTDEFKYPNHMTFSDQSKYSTPQQQGGRWTPKQIPIPGPVQGTTQQWHFYASPFNVQQNGAERMQQYFKTQEPGNVLHLPNAQGGYAEGGAVAPQKQVIAPVTPQPVASHTIPGVPSPTVAPMVASHGGMALPGTQATFNKPFSPYHRRHGYAQGGMVKKGISDL